MLELTNKGLENKAEWAQKGYSLPEFDREQLRLNTLENPVWLHFGAGNIFKAFQAHVVQKLLNSGDMHTGLIAVNRTDYETLEKLSKPHDDLCVLVTLKADGNIEKTVIGSILETCMLDFENEAELSRLKAIFAKPSLQMVSFTITEKGYAISDGSGETLPAVLADFAAGPSNPGSYIGKLCALLYMRYLAGGTPLAMVSMDNCSHNGDKLAAAVQAYASAWLENGFVEKGFLDYVCDEKKLSFPLTMIDKITPRPDASVQELLINDGIVGIAPIKTSRGTYIAPFVNAEECEYLVIEDDFPNGRPPLEKGGLMFTTRETVDKVEKMKVCTCLNPLHTALAIFGCLLGYDKISEEMKDAQLRRLVEIIGYREGLPVVVDPGILDPKQFIDTVLNVRIPNPFLPDTPQRIATDTSQKLPIRFGETIKAYIASDSLELSELRLIPLVFAGWLRYLMAIDDEGEPFTLSDDPLHETVCPYLAGIQLGDTEGIEAALRPILEDASIFGVDLYEAGLAERVIGYFKEMIAGAGAIRACLIKNVN